MEYEVLLEKGNYALISRGKELKEFALISGLNNEKKEWDYTLRAWEYEYKGNPIKTDKATELAKAIDYFQQVTDKHFIPRKRLEELATLFKDGLMEDDKESAMEYFEEICEMTEEEKEWFGINEESEEE